MVDFLALDEWGSALRWTLLAQNEAEDDESLKRITVLESVGRVRRHAAEARVFSAVFKWVPEDYYDRPLAARAELLGCAESQMCKSMIMENTSLPEGCSAEEEKLRYVMVVVQYAAKFNAAKLAAAIRSLPGESAKPKAAHHFRLAPEAVANDMAGVQHNAVSPLGLKTEIFVVVAEAIAQLRSPFIWMGAGHVNLKLGCTTGHLTRALKPLIADISDPR